MGAVGKYNSDLVDKICSLIEQDTYTIEEICKIVGITTTTYFEWKNTKTGVPMSVVYKTLRQSNTPIRAIGRPPRKKQIRVSSTELKGMYDSGRTIREIAETTGIGMNIVYRNLKLANTQFRPRGYAIHLGSVHTNS